MAARRYHVNVVLSDQEATRLDEVRGAEPRAVYMRRLLQGPPLADEAPTHEEAVRLLAKSARAGKVQAQVALERALRDAAGDDDPLEALLRAK